MTIPQPSKPPPSSSKLNSSGSTSNSIIISCPSKIFFHPILQLTLRIHLESYGPILTWTPLTNLKRILIVYSQPHSTSIAKKDMDRFTFEDFELRQLLFSALDHSDLTPSIDPETRSFLDHPQSMMIRVYFGPQVPISSSSSSSSSSSASSSPVLPNPLSIDNVDLLDSNQPEVDPKDRLRPPDLQKNFFISPPGSPPVGWEQTVEDPPNRASLAEDLSRRLRFLSVVGPEDDDDDDDELQTEDHRLHPGSSSTSAKDGAHEILILPAQPSLQLPALKIQPIQTVHRAPGMGIHRVKATIESMMVPRTTQKISPTPRPQLH